MYRKQPELSTTNMQQPHPFVRRGVTNLINHLLSEVQSTLTTIIFYLTAEAKINLLAKKKV